MLEKPIFNQGHSRSYPRPSNDRHRSRYSERDRYDRDYKRSDSKSRHDRSYESSRRRDRSDSSSRREKVTFENECDHSRKFQKSRQTPPKPVYGGMRSDYISPISSSITRKRKSDRERLKEAPPPTDQKRPKSGQSSPKSNGQIVVQIPSTDEKRRSKSRSKMSSKSPKRSRKREKRKEPNGVIPTVDSSGLVITTPVTVSSIKLIVKNKLETGTVHSPVAEIQTVSVFLKVSK